MSGVTKGMKTMGWVVVTAAAAGAFAAAPAQAQTEPISGTELAIGLEAEAARLQTSADGWADAASLYVAAAGHRQHEDPQARQDLFLAANLYHQIGDLPAAMAALESAGVRALSAGDGVLAVQMFANAAQIADEAGLRNDARRLRTRAADVASAVRADGSTRS
ncbi:MAG TPA: hypothetical protein VMM35_09250 [Longimicrobiales bacterium]|nr:hypothetical protein [Longimicrobiales bacterium]